MKDQLLDTMTNSWPVAFVFSEMASAPEDLILDKCMKFHDYDFNGDNSFQIGWKNIAMQSSKDNQTEPFLKAKLFYYSK